MNKFCKCLIVAGCLCSLGLAGADMDGTKRAVDQVNKAGAVLFATVSTTTSTTTSASVGGSTNEIIAEIKAMLAANHAAGVTISRNDARRIPWDLGLTRTDGPTVSGNPPIFLSTSTKSNPFG